MLMIPRDRARILSTQLVLSTFVALLLLALPSAASTRAAKAGTGPDPSVATVAVDAVVAAIESDGTLVLSPAEKGAADIRLRIPEGVKIRAQRKKDFGGRRKLDFADLKVGHRLRLHVLPAEKRLVDVTVLKSVAT